MVDDRSINRVTTYLMTLTTGEARAWAAELSRMAKEILAERDAYREGWVRSKIEADVKANKAPDESYHAAIDAVVRHLILKSGRARKSVQNF